jgi:hypothetical protein
LRTAGLDELPQLLNVLRGDMSLVGPRPEMPFIVKQYTPLQRQRLAAKPGITGLWQLSAERHDAIHVNLEYDLHYIRHQSLLLDGLILLETFIFTLEVAGKRLGGWIRRLIASGRAAPQGASALPTDGPAGDAPPRGRRWVPRATVMRERETIQSLARVEHQPDASQRSLISAARHLKVEDTE